MLESQSQTPERPAWQKKWLEGSKPLDPKVDRYIVGSLPDKSPPPKVTLADIEKFVRMMQDRARGL